MAENRNSADMRGRQAVTASHALLRAENIAKVYRNSKSAIKVLAGLNMDLQRAETLAVVGASGIGKSTLLHILGTLDRPDKGRLFFQGQDVLRYDDQSLARFRNRSMGFIFQFHHLLPEFSALENTMLPGLIQGLTPAAARQNGTSVLTRMGLAARLHQKSTQLSGGEQQRVALARALVLKPALLFADEPTGNLDTKNAEQVHQLLLELNREMGMALIVVTHNMQLASFMGRKATIAEGRLEYISTRSGG